MKIAYLLINANRREGTSRAVVEVAERLAHRHEVTLFARSAPDLDTSRVDWVPLPCPAWPDVAEFLGYKWGVTRALQGRSFDILHSAGCNFLAADVYTIQTVHPCKVAATGGRQRNRNVSWLRRWSRNWYDRCVLSAERGAYVAHGPRGLVGYLPVSDGTQQELLREYPVAEALLEVVPNGADLEFFHPRLRTEYRSAVLAELGIPEQALVLLFAGGEWLRKGLKLALESLAKTSSLRSVLLVAGDDPQRAEYQQLANDLDLGNRVHFLGFRDDVVRLYGAADAFLFPTSYEAFSLATIEAAATGLPVLMPNVSGAAELVGDGTCGVMIDRDPPAVARVLDRLAEDSAWRAELGRNARQRVEQQFNWDAIAKQTEQFYVRLLAARSGKGSAR